MIKLVKNKAKLREVSTNVETVEEAEQIISKLKIALDDSDNGVGLAAIQIGIPKRVGVIKKPEGDYEYLINAEFKEGLLEFVFCREGCLSLPNTYLDTQRYKQVIIQNQRIRDGELQDQTECYYYSNDPTEMGNDGIVAIAVQHELDHFDGKLIEDRHVILPSAPHQRVSTKVGRNEKCPCGSDKKFKKCCLGNGTYD